MRRKINNVFVHVILAILSVIWLFPIFWVVLTSFRAEKGSYVKTFFPKNYTFANYIKLFTDTNVLNFPRMFMNTLIIAICSCIITSIFVLSVERYTGSAGEQPVSDKLNLMYCLWSDSALNRFSERYFFLP